MKPSTSFLLSCAEWKHVRVAPLLAIRAWLACQAVNTLGGIYKARLRLRRATGWRWVGHYAPFDGCPVLWEWHSQSVNPLYWVDNEPETYRRARRLRRLR